MESTKYEIMWNGFTLSKSFIQTSVGGVPLIKYQPENNLNNKVVFAIHYQEGSKEIWLDEENYTSILKYAIDNKIPFYAVDLYGHGEWKSDGDNFNPQYLDDDQWEVFVRNSVQGIKETISFVAKDKEIQFISYSTGCLMAVKVIDNTINTNSLVMASPVPARSYDDEYSLHNNIDVLKNKNVLVLSGIDDEEVEDGEVQWYYDLIQSGNKEIERYKSGHELPSQWSDSAIKFLKTS